MPTPIKATVRSGVTPVKTGSIVRFSDQLTNSITDVAKIIEQHKGMIDSIQEIALELTTSIGTLHTQKGSKLSANLFTITEEINIYKKF